MPLPPPRLNVRARCSATPASSTPSVSSASSSALMTVGGALSEGVEEWAGQA
jgi:hypothetical protein